uniref:Ferredoxin:thioredoxin reductase n=1 Tax=candidate division WOR-3 bacterium TaxID=2052148 RepID=A0A7C1NV14_UNCW3
MNLTPEDQINLDRARKVGEKFGLVLNPDLGRALKVANGLARNFAEYGKYFCPCKQSHPLNPEKDVVCPCPTLMEEIARDGHCHCRLYFHPANLQTSSEQQSSKNET